MKGDGGAGWLQSTRALPCPHRSRYIYAAQDHFVWFVLNMIGTRGWEGVGPSWCLGPSTPHPPFFVRPLKLLFPIMPLLTCPTPSSFITQPTFSLPSAQPNDCFQSKYHYHGIAVLSTSRFAANVSPDQVVDANTQLPPSALHQHNQQPRKPQGGGSKRGPGDPTSALDFAIDQHQPHSPAIQQTVAHLSPQQQHQPQSQQRGHMLLDMTSPPLSAMLNVSAPVQGRSTRASCSGGADAAQHQSNSGQRHFRSYQDQPSHPRVQPASPYAWPAPLTSTSTTTTAIDPPLLSPPAQHALGGGAVEGRAWEQALHAAEAGVSSGPRQSHTVYPYRCVQHAPPPSSRPLLSEGMDVGPQGGASAMAEGGAGALGITESQKWKRKGSSGNLSGAGPNASKKQKQSPRRQQQRQQRNSERRRSERKPSYGLQAPSASSQIAAAQPHSAFRFSIGHAAGTSNSRARNNDHQGDDNDHNETDGNDHGTSNTTFRLCLPPFPDVPRKLLTLGVDTRLLSETLSSLHDNCSAVLSLVLCGQTSTVSVSVRCPPSYSGGKAWVACREGWECVLCRDIVSVPLTR